MNTASPPALSKGEGAVATSANQKRSASPPLFGRRVRGERLFGFEHVYQVVCLVPYGRVTTYGAIARYLGSAQSARMVGWAMNVCHRHVPAHRVINRQGLLTGKRHFGGDDMQQLLEAEGIKIKNNRVVDFDKHFWDPNIELG